MAWFHILLITFYFQVCSFWKCVFIITLGAHEINSPSKLKPWESHLLEVQNAHFQTQRVGVRAAMALIHTVTIPQIGWHLRSREGWIIAWLFLLQKGHRQFFFACPEAGSGWFAKCQPEMAIQPHAHIHTWAHTPLLQICVVIWVRDRSMHANMWIIQALNGFS